MNLFDLSLEIIQLIFNYVPCLTINNLLMSDVISLDFINLHTYNNCECSGKIFSNTGNLGWKCVNGKFISKPNCISSLHCLIKKEKYNTNNEVFELYSLSIIAAQSSDVYCLKKLNNYGIKFDKWVLYYAIGYCNMNNPIDEKKCFECVKFILTTECEYDINSALHYAKHTNNKKCISLFSDSI